MDRISNASLESLVTPRAACQIVLEAGEMLYMPERSWHYMEYDEPNVSVTVPFYVNDKAKDTGYFGPESIAWQLLTNEWSAIPTWRWRYYTWVIRIPVTLVATPYLAVYPLAMAYINHSSPALTRACETVHRIGTDRILYTINIFTVCCLGLGPPKAVFVARLLLVLGLALVACTLVVRGEVSLAQLSAGITVHHLTMGAMRMGFNKLQRKCCSSRLAIWTRRMAFA